MCATGHMRDIVEVFTESTIEYYGNDSCSSYITTRGCAHPRRRYQSTGHAGGMDTEVFYASCGVMMTVSAAKRVFLTRVVHYKTI